MRHRRLVTYVRSVVRISTTRYSLFVEGWKGRGGGSIRTAFSGIETRSESSSDSDVVCSLGNEGEGERGREKEGEAGEKGEEGEGGEGEGEGEEGEEGEGEGEGAFPGIGGAGLLALRGSRSLCVGGMGEEERTEFRNWSMLTPHRPQKLHPLTGSMAPHFGHSKGGGC